MTRRARCLVLRRRAGVTGRRAGAALCVGVDGTEHRHGDSCTQQAFQ